MIALALHAVHLGVIVLGTLAVGAVLLRVRRAERTIETLRCAGADGIVALAEARARRADPVLTRGAAIASGAALVAGAVHAAVLPEHVREGWRFGAFFLALAITQFALAYAVARRPGVAVLTGLAAVSAATVVLWLITRLVALPFGLDTVEPIGVWDTVASLAEVAAAGFAMRTVRRLLELPARRRAERGQPVGLVVG